MIEGLDVNERIEYSLTADKGDVKTIFVFRPLDSVEQMNMVNDDGTVAAGAKFIFPYLNKVIVEIRNFKLKGKDMTVVEEILPLIKPDYLTELLKFSQSLNGVSEQLAKN